MSTCYVVDGTALPLCLYPIPCRWIRLNFNSCTFKVCVRACVCMCMYAIVYMCVCLCVYVHLYVCACVYMCICMCVLVCSSKVCHASVRPQLATQNMARCHSVTSPQHLRVYTHYALHTMHVCLLTCAHT